MPSDSVAAGIASTVPTIMSSIRDPRSPKRTVSPTSALRAVRTPGVTKARTWGGPVRSGTIATRPAVERNPPISSGPPHPVRLGPFAAMLAASAPALVIRQSKPSRASGRVPVSDTAVSSLRAQVRLADAPCSSATKPTRRPGRNGSSRSMLNVIGVASVLVPNGTSRWLPRRSSSTALVRTGGAKKNASNLVVVSIRPVIRRTSVPASITGASMRPSASAPKTRPGEPPARSSRNCTTSGAVTASSASTETGLRLRPDRHHVAHGRQRGVDAGQRGQVLGPGLRGGVVGLDQTQIGADLEVGLVLQRPLGRAGQAERQRADRDREREQQHRPGVRAVARPATDRTWSRSSWSG